MIKPFFIKKKNIDNRLVPVVSAADAGKVLGVTEDGEIAPVEAGGGGGDTGVLHLYASQINPDLVYFDEECTQPFTRGGASYTEFYDQYIYKKVILINIMVSATVKHTYQVVSSKLDEIDDSLYLYYYNGSQYKYISI